MTNPTIQECQVDGYVKVVTSFIRSPDVRSWIRDKEMHPHTVATLAIQAGIVLNAKRKDIHRCLLGLMKASFHAGWLAGAIDGEELYKKRQALHGKRTNGDSNNKIMCRQESIERLNAGEEYTSVVHAMSEKYGIAPNTVRKQWIPDLNPNKGKPGPRREPGPGRRRRRPLAR